MVVAYIEPLLIGALAAVSIVFTFQTRIPYPAWLLKSYEDPWVFVVMIIAVAALGRWSLRVSALLMLLLVALWIDGFLFIRNEHAPLAPQKPSPLELDNYTEDPSLAAPALQSVPLPEPNYPIFMAIDDFGAGPAPF